MKNIVQEIKDAVSLREIVQKKIKLRKAGHRWVGLCPFHQEKTPSFAVTNDFFYCFGCHKGGDVFSYLMDTERLDFKEALENLCNLTGIKMPVNYHMDPQQQAHTKSLYEILSEAKDFFCSELAKNRAALDYLTKREVGKVQISKFEIGFSSAKNDLLEKFSGIDDLLLLESGLFIKDEQSQRLYPRFRNRIIFPIYDLKKRVIGFGGRAIEKGAMPKYLNSPESSLFKKSQILYNQQNALNVKNEIFGEIIIVEGYLDVVALDRAGFNGAVATMGTAVSEHHLQLLWKYSDHPIMCFDGDRAGIAAMNKVVDVAFPHLLEGKSLKFLTLPNDLDPDDIIRQHGDEYFRKLLKNAMNLSEFVWANEIAHHQHYTPELKSSLEKKLADLANSIKNNIVRKNYVDFFRNKFWSHFKVGKKKKEQIPSGYNLEIPCDGLKVSDKFQLSVLAQVLHNPALLLEKFVMEEFFRLEFANDKINQLHSAVLELIDLEKIDVNNYDIKLGLEEFGNEIEFLCGINNHFLIGYSPANLEVAVLIWKMTFKKYQISLMEGEYQEMMRVMTQESFEQAMALKAHLDDVRRDVATIESEIENFE